MIAVGLPRQIFSLTFSSDAEPGPHLRPGVGIEDRVSAVQVGHGQQRTIRFPRQGPAGFEVDGQLEIGELAGFDVPNPSAELELAVDKTVPADRELRSIR